MAITGASTGTTALDAAITLWMPVNDDKGTRIDLMLGLSTQVGASPMFWIEVCHRKRLMTPAKRRQEAHDDQ